MKDEQIIKAMEVCLKRADMCVCTVNDCPYADSYECTIKLWRDALSLIKRYQAEIDLLKMDNEQISAADVVEVVRCKDCKHSRIDDFYAIKKWCWKHYRVIEDENDFCSYGEK